jgi:hypothetical protein
MQRDYFDTVTKSADMDWRGAQLPPNRADRLASEPETRHAIFCRISLLRLVIYFYNTARMNVGSRTLSR